MLPDAAVAVPLLGVAVVGAHGYRRRARAGDTASVRATALRGTLGLLVVLAALAPAVDGRAHTSFAWHMVQHQLLLLVAAPLLASAAPVTTLAAALGRAPEPARPVAREAAAPAVLLAAVVSVATLLAWHLPALYDAALASPALHALEHVLLLGTATLTWLAVVASSRDDRAPAAIVALAASAIVGAGLGVVLLAAPEPLYAYAGASAVSDQQLGGALMKVGAILVHAGAAVWLGVRWLRRLEVAV